jgi:alcohol dehydrogenase class IV
MDSEETYKPAFTEPPGTNLAGIPVQGLVLPSPFVSYGRPYQESCAKHVKQTFQASKVYIIASASLAKNTDRADRLVQALGEDTVVGFRRGITPHTPWSEILSIAQECRASAADCVVTIGAGSVTDGAKLVVLVR